LKNQQSIKTVFCSSPRIYFSQTNKVHTLQQQKFSLANIFVQETSGTKSIACSCLARRHNALVPMVANSCIHLICDEPIKFLKLTSYFLQYHFKIRIYKWTASCIRFKNYR